MKKFLLLPLLAFAALALPRGAHAADAGAFFNNTLYCQNQTSFGTCTLWLNQDGSYQVFFDRGVQKIVPQSAAGPFQYEGRTGTYSIKTVGTEAEACLKPDTSTAFTYNTEKAGEIYAGAGCYQLPKLGVGQSLVTPLPDGKVYKFWLLAGR